MLCQGPRDTKFRTSRKLINFVSLNNHNGQIQDKVLVHKRETVISNHCNVEAILSRDSLRLCYSVVKNVDCCILP